MFDSATETRLRAKDGAARQVDQMTDLIVRLFQTVGIETDGVIEAWSNYVQAIHDAGETEPDDTRH